MRLILASRSPRRLRLLREIGVEPLVRPAGIDESPRDGERPLALVRRLAEAKGRGVLAALSPPLDDLAVVAADTAVVLGDRALGQPRDDAEAIRMLRSLSDREHTVLTGLFLCRGDDGRSRLAAAATRVRFHPLDAATIRAYVATGEPRGKAGAYAIQGRGGELVRGVTGSWSNVVGLPLELLGRCLDELAIDVGQSR